MADRGCYPFEDARRRDQDRAGGLQTARVLSGHAAGYAGLSGYVPSWPQRLS